MREDAGFYITEWKPYKQYELNLDKVNSLEDCKKILKFLCDLSIKPLPEDVSYNGFSEVEEYFEEKEIS